MVYGHIQKNGKIVHNEVDKKMTKHTIYDHEIKIIMDAANQLFSPQDGKGDDRSSYQAIYHMLEEIKGRAW